MRIYSNKYLTAVERICLWKMFEFPRIGLNPNDIIFKINNTSNNELSFQRTNMYTKVPLGFVTQFVWEYPDKQIGVCSLDLKTYDIYPFGKLYRNAVKLPEVVNEGDLVYVDTTSLVNPSKWICEI